MPVLAKFYGIVIRLFCSPGLGDRLHICYGDAEMVLDLETLQVIQDETPRDVRERVLAWSRQHHGELLIAGRRARRHLPQLEFVS